MASELAEGHTHDFTVALFEREGEFHFRVTTCDHDYEVCEHGHARLCEEEDCE